MSSRLLSGYERVLQLFPREFFRSVPRSFTPGTCFNSAFRNSKLFGSSCHRFVFASSALDQASQTGGHFNQNGSKIIISSKLPNLKQYPDERPLNRFILDDNVKRFRDKAALVNGITGKVFTYEDTSKACRRFGAAMSREGISRGDVVIFYAQNCPEYIICALGVIGLGASISTVNPSYTVNELVKQVSVLPDKTNIILTTSHLLPVIKEAESILNRCFKVVLLDDEVPGLAHYDQLVGEHEGHTLSEAGDESLAANDDAPAYIPFSSGTTGWPKGVVLTQGNLKANVCQMTEPGSGIICTSEDGQQQPCLICILPMFHVFGFVISSLAMLKIGAKLITLPRFTPETYLECIVKHKPTVLHQVPPLMQFLALSSLVDPSHLASVKMILAGAAPVGTTLKHMLNKKVPHIKIVEGWGMTENSSMAIVTFEGNGETYSDLSCGTLLPNAEARIIDITSGQDLGPGKTGELLIRGPHVMKGYLNNREATEKSLTADGWFSTGDIAYYDEKEHFYIVDRLKELIKVKGFQVAPSELEDLLRSHEDVEDVAVIGVPHETNGEAPKAFVVLRQGHLEHNDEAAMKKELFDLVSSQTAEFKWLRGGIEFIQAIPKTASGKILRKNLRP